MKIIIETATQENTPDPRIELRELRRQYLELDNLYNELINAIFLPVPGETRHQTALRYIKAVEENERFRNDL